MRERSDLQLLRDARNSADRAYALTGGMSLDMMKEIDYYDHATRSYLIIIGEALSNVSPDLKAARPDIPWQAVRGLRNRLVHAYWRIDHDIVQRIVRDELPVLISALDGLIAVTERDAS